jgi:hypothetical protein
MQQAPNWDFRKLRFADAKDMLLVAFRQDRGIELSGPMCLKGWVLRVLKGGRDGRAVLVLQSCLWENKANPAPTDAHDVVSIAIVSAAHLCLHGSRGIPMSKMSNDPLPQWEDKAGLGLFRHHQQAASQAMLRFRSTHVNASC